MKKVFPVILVLLIIVTIIYFIFFRKEYNFSIYFFNAGKADAILINNNNRYIMIDTAEDKFSDNILEYFKDNNIDTIDYLIITHFDKDHVGGASKIIDNINVKNVFQSNYPKDSEYYKNFIESLKNKNIEAQTIVKDYSFNLEDMIIVINGPSNSYDKNESNNSSLITKIKYKNNDFLFMGDAENARIRDFVSENSDTFDFIKVPYHGRKLKRLDELLENTKPKYAVITSSYDTDNTDTLNTLKKHNIKTYITRDGDICVYSDGNKIRMRH